MVYNEVFLVGGIVIDRDVAIKKGIINEEGDIFSPYYNFVHHYPCCSALADDKLIVGKKLYTYERKKGVFCNSALFGAEGCMADERNPNIEYTCIEGKYHDKSSFCGGYYRCDICFGKCVDQNSHMYSFDVSQIFDNIVEVPLENICTSCYVMTFNTNKCELCCSNSNESQWDLQKLEIINMCTKFGIEGEPKFYLMVNDCLYCS